MNDHFDVSVIICTYNRCDILPKALQSVLSQKSGDVRYEVLIVDNNSTDDTRQVCESFLSQGHVNLRYIFETKQGISHARNTGIANARAPLLAFTDDDVFVSDDWVVRIKQTFDDYPGVDGIGGKVLPNWESEPPGWLTREHWTPLALLDFGDRPASFSADNPICLIGANFAFRREVFNHVGLFSPSLQRVGGGIGSMEDHELLLRLWRTNRQTLYVPEIVVTAEVQSERLTKQYHRKWHTGHGHFYALLREEDFERSAARLFDVPAHLYKQTLVDAMKLVKHRLFGKDDIAFMYETRLCFFVGFFRTRRRQFSELNNRSILREVVSFIRSLVLPKEPRKAP
ncbi:MAG TPA: glycosyltransferase [Blastocatellia bacterium]|jgi:glycosyltransferase involved in cell wall biosynthesis|nr:glycosyltransferase [Blastocatellia bacterium]